MTIYKYRSRRSRYPSIFNDLSPQILELPLP